MNINDKKDKLNNTNYFSNKQKKFINLNYCKKNFNKFPFTKIKNISSKKSKFGTENDDLYDYSHSIKKTMSTLNSNNEIIKSKDVFTTKRNLINKNIIGKIINSNPLKKEKIATSTINIKTLNKSVGTQNEYTIEQDSKFPKINQKINKNVINISFYNTKYETFRRQSLQQNFFLPTNILIQKSKRLKSSRSNELSSKENSIINNKCNYLILKYNEKENKKKNKKILKKLDVNSIINLINAFLIPKEKTFEILENLINNRIINKENLKTIDDSFLMNQNCEGHNKIIEAIFKDIIKKIYKKMLKIGIKLNSKINKDEIKKEYKNQINNLKTYLDIVEKNKEKNFLNFQTSSTNGIKKNKKYIKIKLKRSKDNKLDIKSYLFKNEENNKNKNKSCDNIIYHYYNFDEAANEIIKQNLLKEKINKIYNNCLYSIPIDNEYIKKLKFKNSFINKCISNEQNKDRKRKNNDNIQEFNKILMNSDRFSENKVKTSVKCIFNNISMKKEKDNVNLNQFYNSQNNEKIVNNNKNNSLAEKNNENSLNFSNRNNANTLNDIYNKKKMNKFKIVYKNEKIQEKFYDKYQSGIFSKNRNKKFNKNGDIIKLIQNKKDNEKKISNKEEKNKIENYSKIKLSKNNIKDIIKKEKDINKIENDSQTSSDFYESKDEINSSNCMISNSSSLTNSNYINKIKKKLNEEIMNKENKKNKENKINNEDIIKKDKENRVNKINNPYKANLLISNPISSYCSLNQGNMKNIKKSIKRRIKRYNSISFLSKKEKYKHNFNRESFSFFDFSQKIKQQGINSIINKDNFNIIKSYKRHNSISQNYLQLFFKNDNKKNNLYKNIKVKRKYHKRKTKRELTFKEFIKDEEEEEEESFEKDIKESESIKDEEEFKENKWEAKFNVFKDYIQKLKKMSNEEFIKDTLKFIEKYE